MAWHDTRISNWSELIEKFDSFPAGKPWDKRYLFRGQSDESLASLRLSLSSMGGFA